MNDVGHPPHTNIEINASKNDVLRILRAQYAHMNPADVRVLLEKSHIPVWSNDELLEVFEVAYFDPPHVNVIRKADGVRGTVAFIDVPRFYFAFQPEENNDARTPRV